MTPMNPRRLPVAVVLALALCACTGDRQILFEIRRDLVKGMPKADVDQVVKKDWTSSLFQQSGQTPSPSGGWIRIGSHDACIFTLRFQDDRLVEAQLRDGDSVTTPCRGAPPDLT
jgi:hypothetical protein